MKLDGHEHIEESDRLRYVDGELDEVEVEQVERHLATCATCRDGVDDLAAASDSLTAFLQQSDYPPRALVYRARAGRAWWASPWAVAAGLVLLLGGVATPGLLFSVARGSGDGGVPRADAGEGPVLVPAPAPAPAPAAPPAAAVPPVVVVPSEAPVAVVPDWDRSAAVASVDRFTIEVSSWQAGGSLNIVFADTDVFLYQQGDGGGTTASINTQRGFMLINTTADSRTSHEVIVPSSVRNHLTVRVAGQEIPLPRAEAGTTGISTDGVVSSVRVGPGQETMRIDLTYAHRPG